jgi:hypothetical protein
MGGYTKLQIRKWGILSLAAAALPALSFAMQGAFGISLWDEGFLWYGVQRVMAGEVPIRDFMAYDVGRYYGSAAVMNLTGSHGILALRATWILIQAFGIGLATFLVLRAIRYPGNIFTIIVSGIFFLWMNPAFRVYDHAASIALIAALAFVLEKPSVARHFLSGVALGIVAIIGRNHGLYGAIGGLGAIVYLAYLRKGPRPLAALSLWLAGVAVGYLPMIVALVLVPGLARSFWEGIRFQFEYKATNIALPFPQLWEIQFSALSWVKTSQQVGVRLLFLAIPPLGAISFGRILFPRFFKGTSLNPIFVAATLLMVPYAHYAFSRTDLTHLALGIFPFLLGAITFPIELSRRLRLAIAGSVLAASVVVMLPEQPGYYSWRYGGWRNVRVGADMLKVPPEQASNLSLLKTLADRYAPNGRTFLATPFWPGAYAVLERKAPIWEIYALFPQSESVQEKEIARIRAAKPGFAIVLDLALNGREDLRYRNTHPLIERYIRTAFRPIEEIGTPQELQVYVAASEASGAAQLPGARHGEPKY